MWKIVVQREMKWMVMCISMKWITLRLGVVLFSFTLIWTNAVAEVSNERQGQLLYLLKHDCGSCHGMTLKGGLGPPLLPDTLANKPSELLVNTILHGRSGTPMAPWGRFLSEQEARWLVERLQRGEIDAR
jgi:cytochrome c55X